MQPDYYQVLQVSPDATFEQIKQAYRRLARQFHPDVAGSSAKEHFQAINEAYRVLSDPRQRRAFDLSRHGPEDRAKPRVVVRTDAKSAAPGREDVELERRIQTVRQALREQKWRGAAHEAEALMQQYPGNLKVRHLLALTYQRLGNAFLQRGESRQAKYYLLRALEIEPDNAELGFDVNRDLNRL